MPLYEIQCRGCGRIEEHLKKKYPNGEMLMPCQDCYMLTIWDVIPSVCTMQPDTMWAGHQTGQGYFTSKSQYEKTLKDRNLETLTSYRDVETVRKNVAKAKIDKKEKQLNNLKKHLTEELKGVMISPDGNTLKEQNKYERDRNK